MGPFSKGLQACKPMQAWTGIVFVLLIFISVYQQVSSEVSLTLKNQTVRKHRTSTDRFENKLAISQPLTSSSTDGKNDVPLGAAERETIFPSDISINTKLIKQAEQEERLDEIDAGELLRKALINHTMTHGGAEDLDQLIFTAIPEGSKLVVQSFKIIKTDEDGNPLDEADRKAPMHWDVKLTNVSDLAIDEDEGDDEEDEEGVEQANSPGGTDGNIDLQISGSHAQANYKEYGGTDRKKSKNTKNYHGQDHGKTHKITDTDTDGKKVTNYKGNEKGVTDYDHAKGNSQNKEGERYRDSKKKNKGRRVSGFKRVYHKEEFQRTEHFYDDEEAKRIAESYGLKDAKETAKHGIKDDDREYHGIRKEITDGNKIKNEHGTSKGYNKGTLTEYKDSEKHKLSTNYDKSHSSPNNQQYHPNHNYHGSYSSPRKSYRKPNNYPLHEASPETSFSNDGIVAQVSKAPMMASFTVSQYENDSASVSSTDMPMSSHSNSFAPSEKDNQNSDELRMFYSPRDRYKSLGTSSADKVDITANQLKTHFRGRAHQKPNHIYLKNRLRHVNTIVHPGYPPTPFRNRFGNASWIQDDLLHRNLYRPDNASLYSNARYAGNFSTSTARNTIFGSAPESFSTIVKVMPVNYINLTDDSRSSVGDSRQSSISYNSLASPATNLGNSVYSQNSNPSYRGPTYTSGPKHSLRTPHHLRRRPPNPRNKWLSISIGDQDLLREMEIHPNHPDHPPHFFPEPVGHGLRGSFAATIVRPPHGGKNHYDSSKYPPNEVKQHINRNRENPLISYAPQQSQLQTVNGQTPATTGYNPSQKNQANHYLQKGPKPRPSHSLPPFMNNLMDSVANFFNVG